MSRADFQSRELERLEASEQGREYPVLVAALVSQADVEFCEEYARHGDEVKAVVRSGLAAIGLNDKEMAARTLARPEIRVAVQALRKARARLGAGLITRASILADVEEVFHECKVGKRYDWQLAAKRLQAQMLGLLIEKREVVHTRKIEDMSDTELMAIANKAKVKADRVKAIETTFEEVGTDVEIEAEPVRAGIGWT